MSINRDNRRSPRWLAWAGAFVAVLVVAFAPAAATATTADEERQGERILRDFERGGRDCATLAETDFERIGEYAMGRMAGSTAAHESMNRLMSQMMGERGEEQMHVALGQRFSGCGDGEVPESFGAMMGAMGMMGGYGPGASGGQMSFPGAGTASARDRWSAADTVMSVVMALVLLAAGAGLWMWKPWRRAARRSPLDVLRERLARGDIEPDEFERRRQALGATR